MKSFFVSLWETLRASYWFVPALMAAGAFGLSYGLLTLDRRLNLSSLTGLVWISAGGAAGALRTVHDRRHGHYAAGALRLIAEPLPLADMIDVALS